MAGLTGTHLAIYDELLREGALLEETLVRELRPGVPAHVQLEYAIGWLARHRFLTRDDGRWRARPVLEARQMFEQSGPVEPAQIDDEVKRDPETAAQRPAVHMQQVSWF